MQVNVLNVKGKLDAGVDQLIERKEVTGSAITSYTFSNLAGNTDRIYYVKARFVAGVSDTYSFWLRPNNDASGSNYGFQNFDAKNTTASSSRGSVSPGFEFGGEVLVAGEIVSANALIFAKSGSVRVAITEALSKASGTSVTRLLNVVNSWVNTIDEVTSLVVASGSTNGIGVGSVIELWARRGVQS